MEDVSFEAEHVPSISTINRVIRLTCITDTQQPVSSYYLFYTLEIGLVNFMDFNGLI